MPGKSTFLKAQEIFAAICKIDGFTYTEDEMWGFVKQTDLKNKIKEPANKSSTVRKTSAYSLFMKKNKKGMDDTKELGERWNKMKDEENEEYKRYVEMAQEKDKEKGLEPSSGSKTQSQTQEKKLLIELINARVEGTEDEGKPMFLGKKIDSPVNNYKEWKKAQLEQDTPISRDELKKYKDEDEFNDKSMEGMEWDNYIRENMIFAEDV
tara:strand:- start:33 stop:659 length:627 start_codon:yes stop_codon:yes gene_type:complete